MSIISTPLFQRLLALSPFSESELVVLIVTAPARYKTHFIQKRGGRGLREISQPTKEIKFLQRLLIREELHCLPIHDAAMGYRRGKSIDDHARPHAAQRYLLKLDFRDFFPSLKLDALEHRLSIDTSYSPLERWMLGRMLCRNIKRSKLFQLSIGAPSSPHISNYLLQEFDSTLSDYCTACGVRYTRYADDLAFSTSTPGMLDDVEAKVRSLVIELSYLGLSLNETKTINVSTKNRRTLVGLTLSNQGQASIGREIKRELRSMIHRASLNMLGPTEIGNLRGRLSFTYAIDPEFVLRLLSKHGFAAIEDIGRTSSG